MSFARCLENDFASIEAQKKEKDNDYRHIHDHDDKRFKTIAKPAR